MYMIKGEMNLHYLTPSGEEKIAVLRRVEPPQAVEERGLARPVGPDQSHDLARVHGEGDAVEGHDTAEAHREVLNREERGGGRRRHCQSDGGLVYREGGVVCQ